jgi:hypothetical protein
LAPPPLRGVGIGLASSWLSKSFDKRPVKGARRDVVFFFFSGWTFAQTGGVGEGKSGGAAGQEGASRGVAACVWQLAVTTRPFHSGERKGCEPQRHTPGQTAHLPFCRFARFVVINIDIVQRTLVLVSWCSFLIVAMTNPREDVYEDILSQNQEREDDNCRLQGQARWNCPPRCRACAFVGKFFLILFVCSFTIDSGKEPPSAEPTGSL